jgi:hypothetical protein
MAVQVTTGAMLGKIAVTDTLGAGFRGRETARTCRAQDLGAPEACDKLISRAK